VNEVTEVLFRDYATPAALADADPAAIEAIIRPTGFYRQKAKSIQSAARDLAALLPKREWTTFTNRVICLDDFRAGPAHDFRAGRRKRPRQHGSGGSEFGQGDSESG